MMSSVEPTDWRQRFPGAEKVIALEGGAFYSAEAEGAWWLIATEHDPLEGSTHTSITRFEDPLEWKQALTSKRCLPTKLSGERALVESLPSIATGLEDLAHERGLVRVNERDHLQPVSRAQLEATAATVDPQLQVGASRKLEFPQHFPRVGDVDITIGRDQGPPLFVELKCGEGTNALGPCAWDVIKCALTIRMAATPAAYLLAATTASDWERPIRGAEFFLDGSWSVGDIRETYADWFRSWEKGGDPRPRLIPAEVKSTSLGEAAFDVAGTRWVVKLSRVAIEPRGWFEWHPMLDAER